MDKNNQNKNHAYIDGQNLYMATLHSDNPWIVDLARFRAYLLEKYHVSEAYYYLGYANGLHQDKKLSNNFFAYLDEKNTKHKIGKKKRVP